MLIPRDLKSLIQPGMGMKVLNDISEYDYQWENGRMLVWEAPEGREQYALGVDPAEGVGADRSVCEVIKLGNLEHPSVQVAEFCCDFLDPVDFSSIVATIGRFYSSGGEEAFCTVEVNAPCGDTMVTDLRTRHDYANLYIWKQYDRINNVFTNKYGWWTNRTSRPKLIARGLHAFANGDLIVNSPFLLDEMGDFERDHFIAKAKAAHGRHDDRIMALLIAYWGAFDESWLNGEDIDEERRMYQKAKGMQREQAVAVAAKKRVDFQNRPVTYKQMYEEADSKLLDGWMED